MPSRNYPVTAASMQRAPAAVMDCEAKEATALLELQLHLVRASRESAGRLITAAELQLMDSSGAVMASER